MSLRRLVPTVVASAVAVVAAGCGGSAAGDADGKLSVATSTSAWAGVVRAVAGDSVTVSAVIDDPVADPHSYESTAEDALTFTKADLVVINGGGYDAFADKLAEQAPDVPVIDAFAVSGRGSEEEHDHDHGDDHAEDHDGHAHEHGAVNEHVWFDLDTVEAVADEVVAHLGALAPERKAEFEANGKKFAQGLAKLRQELTALRKAAAGQRVIATEPVAFYLLDAAGLHDVTPKAFSSAIEGDSDVPVAAQAEVTRLVERGEVTAVVHNPQTETEVTQQLVATAERSGTPVVEISETLPEGESDYLRWLAAEIEELKTAVARP